MFFKTDIVHSIFFDSPGVSINYIDTDHATNTFHI